MSASASLIQVTLALMLMVGLILGLAWLMRRFGQPLLQQQKKLQLVATLSLGIKEKIVLIEVEGKQLVLGVTPQQITSLHVLDVSPDLIDDQTKSNNEKSGSSDKVLVPEKTLVSDFSKKLLEILKINQPTP